MLQRLARGAMGEVYVALDEATEQRVALKRMRAEARAQPSALEHFRMEYRALRALQHPRIIQVHDYGHDGELPYYTMELLDGEDLRALAPLPYREACRYLRDVASSVALLHARRLLHRDLSPRNVRRTSDGRCKLIDFGTMAPFGTPPNIAGTAPFLPPEALAGKSLDQRADLYSLGALAYWLLTGHHAHDVRSFDELPESQKTPPPLMRRHVREIPKALDDLVLSLLEPNPDGRPGSAAEVIDHLGSIGELPPDDLDEVSRSYLSRTALVGREDVRAQIEKRIARAVAGRGGALHVHGAAGVGKSRVLEDAQLIAQTHGLLTVASSARQLTGEGSVARSLAQALLTAAPREARDAMPAQDAGALESLLDGESTIPQTSDDRAELLRALGSWFGTLSEVRPLLVAVDDVDRADELSSAFIAALALEIRRLPILIIASGTRTAAEVHDPALEAFLADATRIALSSLNASQTTELVASSFGAVPNVERVASWVYRNAHGNPALSIELIRHLDERGLASFVGGTWVLPDTEITEEAPQELRRVLALRLGKLEAEARRLIELLAILDAGADISLIVEASGLDATRARQVLEQLATQGIVSHAEGQYVLRLEAMREAVELAIESHRRRELHARLAEALLRDAGDDLHRRMRGGWHLSHTVEELRGAEILARTGPVLLRAGFARMQAADAVERALEIFERHGRPLAERLRLRSYLTLAGYLADPRFMERYGASTAAELYELSGLARAARWTPRLGRRLALYLSLLWTSVTRLFVPRARRPPNPAQGIVYLGRAAMAMMGVRATTLDGPGTAETKQLLAPLVGSRIPGASQVASASSALALQPLGKERELCRALDQALAELKALNRRMVPGMRPHDELDLHVGLLLARGINEAYRPGRGAIAIADEIDELGGQLSTICAERVRMVYYTVRGIHEEAERSRRLIELHGIRGGSTWQVNAFAQPVEGLAGAMYGDVVATRRALDQLEKIVERFPSMTPLRDLVLAGYHFARGDHERAVEVALAFIDMHPPRAVIGWACAYTIAVNSLIELGRGPEAVAIARRGWAAVPEEDRDYFAMYTALEGSLALAEGMVGNLDEAETIFAQVQERLTEENDGAVVAIAHEYRASMARLRGDRETLLDSLAALANAARRSRSAVLMARVDRFAALSTRMTIGSDPPPDRGAVDDSGAETAVRGSPEETLVTRVLGDITGTHARALQTLRLVAQSTGASRGFVMVPGGDGPELVASLESDDPPDTLEERLAELLASGRAGSQGRLVLPPEDDDSEPTSYMVVLLGGEERNAAVVALEDGGGELVRLRSALVEQLGRGLSAG